MTNDLRSAIDSLAATFAASIVTAIRSSNLEDILGLSGAEAPAPARRGPGRPRKTPVTEGVGMPRPLGTSPKAAAPAKTTGRARAREAVASAKKPAKAGRLQRRSPAEIAKALGKVVALVKSDAGGLRAEQIRDRLGMASKEMPRVLKEGLSKKVLKSKGVKRSTTYTAA